MKLNAYPVSRRRFIGQLSAAGALALLPCRVFAGEPGKKLGVALVGLGYYSRGELGPALKLTQRCQLTGVVTGSREKGVRWAKEYGFPEKNIYNYDTMPQLADNPDIDIVYVVTPNGLHAEHCIAAAQAGKHVICEKPMANSVADCDAIIAACKAAKVQLSVGYRLHFDPYHKELMRLAQTDQFGPFKKMRGAFSFQMNNRPWRAIRKYSGGGPLMDVGIYALHAACMAAGGVAPLAVTAHELLPKKRPDIFQDVEETITWQMEFPGGTVFDGRSSYQEYINAFRAESEKGWIDFSTAYSYRSLEAKTSRGQLEFKPEVNQQALQMDDFADCIATGRATSVPGELGRRDMAIIEAIYASATAGGKRMEVKA